MNTFKKNLNTSQLRRPILFFKHCEETDISNKNSEFKRIIFCFNLPSCCPVCDDLLRDADFHIPLSLFSSPFDNAFSNPYKIVITMTRGSFYENYTEESDLHIGITDSMGSIHHYDKYGLHVTSPYSSIPNLSTKSYDWFQSIIINPFSSNDVSTSFFLIPPSSSLTFFYSHWENAFKVLHSQLNWSPSNYSNNDNNCYSFVIEFLNFFYFSLFSSFQPTSSTSTSSYFPANTSSSSSYFPANTSSSSSFPSNTSSSSSSSFSSNTSSSSSSSFPANTSFSSSFFPANTSSFSSSTFPTPTFFSTPKKIDKFLFCKYFIIKKLNKTTRYLEIYNSLIKNNNKYIFYNLN